MFLWTNACQELGWNKISTTCSVLVKAPLNKKDNSKDYQKYCIKGYGEITNQSKSSVDMSFLRIELQCTSELKGVLRLLAAGPGTLALKNFAPTLHYNVQVPICFLHLPQLRSPLLGQRPMPRTYVGYILPAHLAGTVGWIPPRMGMRRIKTIYGNLTLSELNCMKHFIA